MMPPMNMPVTDYTSVHPVPGLLVIFYECDKLCWELVIQASTGVDGYIALSGDEGIKEWMFLPVDGVIEFMFPCGEQQPR
jgi:hypothetical protein